MHCQNVIEFAWKYAELSGQIYAFLNSYTVTFASSLLEFHLNMFLYNFKNALTNSAFRW